MPRGPNQQEQVTLDELRILIANVRALIAEIVLAVRDLEGLLLK